MKEQNKLFAIVLVAIAWGMLFAFINLTDNTLILRVLAAAGAGHVMGTAMGYIAGLKSNQS